MQSTGGEHVAMPKFQGIGQRCIGHEGAAETLTLLVESACGVRTHAHCSKTVPEQSEKNNPATLLTSQRSPRMPNLHSPHLKLNHPGSFITFSAPLLALQASAVQSTGGEHVAMPKFQGIGQRCIGHEGAAETLTLLVESACGVRTHAHCSKTVPEQSEKNNPATLLRPRSTASRMPNLHSPHLKLNHPGSFITFSAPLLAIAGSRCAIYGR